MQTKEEKKALRKQYYELNKEKIAIKSKEYYKNNREKIIEATSRWRKDNPLKWQEYYNKQKEKNIQKSREWVLANPMKVKDRIKRTREIWYHILSKMNMLKCKICGYDKCFAAIDYHHLDKKTKKYSICLLLRKLPNEETMEELKKCIPLCANCHRELHYNKDEECYL